jgi:hypothetical protein
MKSISAANPGAEAGPRRWGRAQDRTITDPYKRPRKPREPSVCPQCGAVYRNGRWQWGERPAGANELLCQACHRINDNYPAGVVTLSGSFVQRHRAEILELARHQEEIEKKEHPFNRIMNIEETPDRIVMNTTDVHLPRRIGEAQKGAFHGELHFDYDEDGYFVRVNWRRET